MEYGFFMWKVHYTMGERFPIPVYTDKPKPQGEYGVDFEPRKGTLYLKSQEALDVEREEIDSIGYIGVRGERIPLSSVMLRKSAFCADGEINCDTFSTGFWTEYNGKKLYILDEYYTQGTETRAGKTRRVNLLPYSDCPSCDVYLMVQNGELDPVELFDGKTIMLN